MPRASRPLWEIGEAGLLSRVLPLLAAPGEGVVVGAGDDGAVVRPGGAPLVLTCDMLVEGVHFRRATLPAADLGFKAMAVNVSDVAAMGARPLWAVVSLALPGRLPLAFMEDFYAGLLEAAGRWGVAVVGGDTVGSPGPVVVDVAMVGEVQPGGPFLARLARPGHVLLATGSFGASAAGLLVLEERLPRTGLGRWGDAEDASVEEAVRLHRRPLPRLEAARAVAALAHERGFSVAARDASDGLAAAARALGEAAAAAAVLEEDALPVAPAAGLAEAAGVASALELALFGGEDYELVLAVPAPAAEAMISAVLASGTPVKRVGCLEEGRGLVLRRRDGSRETLPERGFAHFGVPPGRREPFAAVAGREGEGAGDRALAAPPPGAEEGGADGPLAWETETAAPAETRRLGEMLGGLLRPGDAVALTGPLGAGKTVLALGILAGLGVGEDEGSPSFVLINAYRGREGFPVYHVDLYRLGEAAAREDLGWDDLLGGRSVVVIEWADLAGDLLPPARLELRLERREGDGRLVVVEGRGRRGRWLAGALAAAWRAAAGECPC